jgi:phosphatidylserine/phosphatidylglycerophosphate/cardiolipin synthase-like enzyme
MHARSAIVDRKSAYLGSISLSPDSATRNRGAGLILKDAGVVAKLQRRFDGDFEGKSAPVN